MRLFNKRAGIRTPRDGRTKEPEYLSWVRMVRRCYEPSYKGYENYGGRGIQVCEAWRLNYRAFVADMGRKPEPDYSLDRIDNNGDYEPGNCRWVPFRHQMKNRRSNHSITHNGETKCLAEWCRITGFDPKALKYRLARLPVELALNREYRLTKKTALAADL